MKRTSLYYVLSVSIFCFAVLPAFGQSVNCSGVPAWASGTAYTTGQLVTYNNVEYKCAQACQPVLILRVLQTYIQDLYRSFSK